MIRDEKLERALRAMNAILTRARFMAHEANAAELAELLDAAEILPKYIAEEEDATDAFRVALEGIVEIHPECSYVLREFDEAKPVAW